MSDSISRAPDQGLPDVDVWIFDLDNTLYPSSCDLFEQVRRRIGGFIAERFALDMEDASALQRRYFLKYGTTLRGLMTVDGVSPEEFLDYVHDIDVTPVPPSPELNETLEALDGRKLIFTNASTAHAERVMERLGVARHFEAIVDIAASDYLPKPDRRAYDRMIAAHDINPETAVMVEDMAVNLVPAHAMGMTTVWVRTEHDWTGPKPGETHVDREIDDLAGWLRTIVDARDGASG